MLADVPTLHPDLYRLPDDPVGPRVLVPGFQHATSVRGAFGWFSAGWIAKLAPGLAEYLNRHDTAPIDFTVAPAFFLNERRIIEEACDMPVDEAVQQVADVFVKGRIEASALACHALDCLAWMIATERLRLRIAVPKAESNYHPKIWLFDDGTQQVLARGSGNATGQGVASGVEHLDVDVTWIDHSRARVKNGIKILNDWTNGISQGIERVVELPEAFEQDIICTAPDHAPSYANYLDAAAEDHNPAWAIDPLVVLRARFTPTRPNNHPCLSVPEELEWKSGIYSYQGEAVSAWESEPKPEQGTISMATGAGKTVTALICATRVQNRLANKALLVVISAPSIPLVIQWQGEVARFGVTAIAPSLEPNADTALTNLFRGLDAGGTYIVIVTNNQLCQPTFQTTISHKVNQCGEEIETLYIADEAHTLGADGFLSNRPDFFKRRLALSATPERQYDPDGTEAIFDFFGSPVYEFGLDRAIDFCLSPYQYYVHATTLDDDELDEFNDLTRRIGAIVGHQSNRGQKKEEPDRLTGLLIARRKIIETASAKFSLLRTVLERRGPRSLTQTLIYTSAKNPEQFDGISEMLTDLNIRWAPVTQDTTTSRTQLAQTLKTFEEGGYQVLLAKKVLDEGVDIPSVREAFIVASSTVQREWIQRRGRVLRRHPGKQWAIIHDFLALPPVQTLLPDGLVSLKKIVRTELDRAYSFAAHARNATGAEGILAHLNRIGSAFWPESFGSPILNRPGDSILAPAIPQGEPW